MEAGYHPNDESRSWMAERGNLENNATEEDQKDIAAKMPGGNIKPVVPSTTSYRVRVRTTGNPAEGRVPTKIIPTFGGGGIGISSTGGPGGSGGTGGTGSDGDDNTTSTPVQVDPDDGGNDTTDSDNNKKTTDDPVDTEIANADNDNSNTEKPTTDTNRFSMGFCDRLHVLMTYFQQKHPNLTAFTDRMRQEAILQAQQHSEEPKPFLQNNLPKTYLQ